MSTLPADVQSNLDTKPDLIDHIGWDLWRVTQGWKQRFHADMVGRGYAWFGEARGNLIQHIGRHGIPQNELVLRAGMTKQAVQQQLDDLVRDGALERISDPKDARKKLVQFTDLGIEAMSAANDVKRDIEAEYAEIIGKDAMTALKGFLNTIILQQSQSNK
ncbi:MAG: MarR family transcriptional regulator [Hyphomicrobiales bacterium]